MQTKNSSTVIAGSMLPAFRVGDAPAPTDIHGMIAAQTMALEAELGLMSERLGRAFEELSLIHELSRNVHVAKDGREHCLTALTKLLPCVPVDTLTAHVQMDDGVDEKVTSDELIQVGFPMSDAILRQISRESGEKSPVVINHRLRCAPWIDRVIIVDLDERQECRGRLIAVGSRTGEELGTPEVQLLQSIASILCAHLTIHRQFAQMREMFEGTVRAFVSAIDAKDEYTCGHSSRVSELAVSLARQMGLDAEDVENIRMSALLHDIGKIGISDAILRKPGKLTVEEFNEIKKHPELGYRILRDVPQFRKMLPGIRFHHESWDGSGYPQGLRGEEIPLMARIMAVADAFDAMTSTRTYRMGLPLERVLEVFRNGRDQQWDANIVDLLLSDLDRMQRMMAKIAVQSI